MRPLFTIFALAVCLASSSSAFAGISSAKLAEIELRSEEYLSHVADGLLPSQDLSACYPTNSQECVKFIAGSYSSTSEKIAAVKACSGNFGTDCVKFIAGSYSSTSDKIAAATACKGNTNLDCVKFIAGSYSSTSDKLAAAQACTFVELDCVKYVAGSYSSTSEKLEAARACGAGPRHRQ
jgi:hypothetical protein